VAQKSFRRLGEKKVEAIPDKKKKEAHRKKPKPSAEKKGRKGHATVKIVTGKKNMRNRGGGKTVLFAGNASDVGKGKRLGAFMEWVEGRSGEHPERVLLFAKKKKKLHSDEGKESKGPEKVGKGRFGERSMHARKRGRKSKPRCCRRGSQGEGNEIAKSPLCPPVGKGLPA